MGKPLTFMSWSLNWNLENSVLRFRFKVDVLSVCDSISVLRGIKHWAGCWQSRTTNVSANSVRSCPLSSVNTGQSTASQLLAKALKVST